MIERKGCNKKGSFFDINFKSIDKDGVSKKRIFVRAGALAAILIVVCGGVFGLKTVKSISGSGKGINRNEYIILKEGRSINKDYFLGEIKTEDYINVSSKFPANTITEVNVSVGDKVKAGDVLGKVNSEDAENAIEDLKEKNNVSLSKRNKALQQKKMDYDDAVKNRNEETNADIVSGKMTVDNKEDYLNKAKDNYSKTQEQYNNGEVTQDIVDAAKSECETAQNEYDLAKLQLENLRTKLQKAVDDTKQAYEIQKMEVDDSTVQGEIQSKVDDLEKYVLTAPIDGVVVDIRAEVGKNADGVLFKIQNMDEQMVDIYINDSDVDKLEIGQSAVIQPLLTGKSAMTGVLTNIEPISNVISDDKVDLSNKKIGANASYVGQISVDEFKDILKDETKVKVEVTTDDRENIFRVPMSDIVNEDDQNYIYIAKQQGEDYVVEKVNVTLGNKGNLDVEISGEEITEGVIVLNNPQNYQPGLKIKI